jgi:tetratricopeptide (TPR) repeat protein
MRDADRPAHFASKPDWYFQENGRECGPFTMSEVEQRARAGIIRAETMVRREATPWNPASQFEFLSGCFAAPDTKTRMPAAPVSQERDAPLPVSLELPNEAPVDTASLLKSVQPAPVLPNQSLVTVSSPASSRDQGADGDSDDGGKNTSRREQATATDTDSSLAGFYGWLGFFSIGVALGPFVVAVWIVYDLVLDATTYISPQLRPAVLLEIVINFGLLLFKVYVAFAFFRRKSTAPSLVIGLLIAHVAAALLDYIMLLSILKTPLVPPRSLIGSAIWAGIWIPYFLFSKRVKATFVVGLPTDSGASARQTERTQEDGVSIEARRQADVHDDSSPSHSSPSRGSGTEPPPVGENSYSLGPGATAPAVSSSDKRQAERGSSRQAWIALTAGGLFVVVFAGMYALLDTGRTSSNVSQKRAVAKSAKMDEEPANLPDENPKAEARRKSAASVQRGNSLFNTSNYDAAIEAYDHAISEDGENAEAFFQRGRCWRKKRNYDKAIRDFDEAIRLNPGNGEAYHNRGYAWKLRGNLDKAIEDYGQAIHLNPNEASSYAFRGNAWNDKKEYDKALLDYNEAIRLDPRDSFTYTARGDAWSSKGDHEEAIRDYNEAIRLDPKYALAYYSRACAWTELKNYDKAIRDFDEAIRLKPDFAAAYESRLYTLRLKGRR